MTPAGILTTLVEFTGNGASNRGYGPCGAITLGVEGEFYGTTRAGGTNNFGTVFKVTADGVLTTLVDFTGDGAENKGSSPRGTLVLSGDNHFYGTTEYGGGNNSGTVFRITPDGTLTTLAEFNPTGTSHKGFYPQAGVALGNDGNIYGTTLRGGENGYGTIFKMTADGTLTTIRDCNSDSDAYPRSSIIAAADGNLYGTTNGPDGTVFRLILPGSPTVVVSRIAKGNDSALVEAHVNARGAITAVSLEYGTDNLEFPNIVGLAAGLSGYQTRLVGTTLSGLNPGTTYFFRFRAVSGEGVTVSAVHSFSTLSEPLVTTTPATDIAPVSARFNGTVNARNYDATVRFEWGTNGNSFPNTLNGTPTTVVGNADVSVSAPVAGLVKGTTYYYRIVATNAGGTTVSGTQSFRTLTEPTASISGNFALTTTSVRVEGAVDAQGSDSGVVFEYGIDGVSFPNSMTATPGLVAGETSTPVSAVLTTLSQGVTYHYRIRATSAGGIGISPSASFSMNVLSGFTQVFPAAPPEAQGFLFVNLAPSGILHGWRFVGERQWRSSGIPVGGLTTGDRNIEFRPVPGYIQPPRETVSVISGEAATILTRDYYETTSTGSGGLTVTLKPEVLADSSVPQATRAQWRLLGEDDTKWRDSAMSITGLSAGAYLVECKPVAGRTTPVPANVIVNDAQTAAPTITYFLPDAPTGTPPAVLAFEAVSTDQTKPYAHVGQLRSNAGSSTGFVVKQRVVATAAHVVWDDGTLSAVQGLQWLHQQHRGTYEPKPITPRGFYIFDGYAAQRVIDNSPGDSSPESQTLDVAAIYFNEDAGRGGYGGFLASDLAQNEFLLSNANKMLFGYPVDGVATNSQGRMFATSPANVTFTAAFGRTFTTTGIRGFGGNSGGPLCVQFEGGNYYPAAIYLGGTNQTVVRAIDSSVIDLFNRAETSGNGGDNNTGGGITHSSFSSFGNTSQPGALEVIIQPAAARNAGAGWRLKPETSYRLSGNQKTGLNAGDYRLQLNEVSGFQTPSAQTITVNGGQLTEITYTYEEINTAPTISNIPNQSVSAGGSTGPIDFTVGDGQSSSSSLSITRSSSNPTLVSVSSIVLGGSGASRHVEVTPVAGLLGTATITLTVSDGELTDSETFQITVTGTARQTWRFANFGTTFDTGNAADSADPDGDGQTNIDEYAAGTDPNNSSDRFSILTVTKGTSSFTVTAPGKAGRSYWLERRQSLDAGPWVSVDSESPLAVNGTVALTDSSPPENKGFYRVRVSFP
ncbi:MAG: choice-of-anchor tandem repeat GloVer-containing protein [Verrucomicrobiota bacterium]